MDVIVLSLDLAWDFKLIDLILSPGILVLGFSVDSLPSLQHSASNLFNLTRFCLWTTHLQRHIVFYTG